MKQEQSFFRQHPDPFVQIMLNTELVPEKIIPAISNSTLGTNPKVQALILLLLADRGEKPFEEANQFAQSVYMMPCHVDFQLMFLAAWYGNLLGLKNFPLEQMNTIQSTMNGLVSEDTPSEIIATVKCVQAANYSFRWDYLSALKLADEMIEQLPPGSFYHKKYSTFRAMAFYQHGMGTHVNNTFKETSPSEYDEKGLFISQLANCALTGETQEASRLLEKISTFTGHKFLKVLSLTLEMSCSLIFMLDQFHDSSQDSSLINTFADLNKSWARSTQALLERKKDQALHWARLSADEITTREGNPLDFSDYTLVRAELAKGNGSGSKRLLTQLRNRGTQTFIDDFYLARAELLLGNRDLAATHFAKVKAAAKKYQASKRFDFEIALACELKGSELIDLGINSIEVSQQGIEPPSRIGNQTNDIDSIVSVSPEMQAAKNSVMTFANLDFPVMITGETGTGKELIARSLHDMSQRKEKRFLAINCSAIPEALIESEFFGHAPGAFTGARSAYKGIFREAGDGTVFLDEIADISHQLQVSLLRVLETGEARPVGSSTNYTIKCRVIAATNKPLLQLVEEKRFRKDLYYRLQRLEVRLPPLRDRRGDIEELAKYFFNQERKTGEQVTLSQELIDRLKQYNWPGNVRELRNVVQRIRIMSSDKLHYEVSDLERCGYSLQNTIKPTKETTTAPPLQINKFLSSTHKPSTIKVQPPSTIHRKTSDSQNLLNKGSNTFRRKRMLRELFEQHGELKVSEVASLLGVTTTTASSYLQELCREGVIEKIAPTASTKSHYYAKKNIPPSQ